MILTPAQRKELFDIISIASACLEIQHISSISAHHLRDAGERLVELDIARRFPAYAPDRKEGVA